MEQSDVLIPHSDSRLNIKCYVNSLWQLEWELNDDKLPKIQPLVGKEQPKLSSIRDDMVIRRARIGHTNITHKYLMVKEDRPMCDTCDEILTVNHILVEYRIYNNIRTNYYRDKTLKELFKNEKYAEIINFLKEINMYFKF